jgi:hypothetical protein
VGEIPPYCWIDVQVYDGYVLSTGGVAEWEEGACKDKSLGCLADMFCFNPE